MDRRGLVGGGVFPGNQVGGVEKLSVGINKKRCCG